MLKSRSTLNIALLVTAVILIGLVSIGENAPPQTAQQNITTLKYQDINQLFIKPFGKESTTLIKIDDLWRIIQPLNLPANNIRINSILHVVESISQSRFPVGIQDIAQYGLENPELLVTVNDLVIKFGITDPIHNYRYVLVENTIHLISDQFSHFLKSELTYFISIALLPSNSTIEEIELPKTTVLKQDGQWHLEPPTGKVISQEALKHLVDEWQFAQATQIKKYSRNKKNQSKTVNIKLKGDDKAITFKIFSANEDLIFARPDWGIQYHLVSSQAAQMFELPQVKTQ